MNLIPLQYRILALIGLLLSGMGFGYVKGLEHGNKKLEAINVAAAVQNHKTATIIVTQKQITKEVGNEATTLRKRLDTVYPRVRHTASTVKLPAIPDAPSRVDAPTDEPITCADRDAAQDALTILLWQEWAAKNAR